MVSEPILGWFWDLKRRNKSEQKEDDLDTADDRESCQESHGASNQTYLGIKLDLLVFFYLVKGCRVKIDLDELESRLWNFFSWNGENQILPDKRCFQLFSRDIKDICCNKMRAKTVQIMATGLIKYCLCDKGALQWLISKHTKGSCANLVWVKVWLCFFCFF